MRAQTQTLHRLYIYKHIFVRRSPGYVQLSDLLSVRLPPADIKHRDRQNYNAEAWTHWKNPVSTPKEKLENIGDAMEGWWTFMWGLSYCHPVASSLILGELLFLPTLPFFLAFSFVRLYLFAYSALPVRSSRLDAVPLDLRLLYPFWFW